MTQENSDVPAVAMPADPLAAFWRHSLDHSPESLQLPTVGERPNLPSVADQVQLRMLSSLIEKLNRLGQRHGLSLYEVLFTGLAVVLGRWSGQDAVVIGGSPAQPNHDAIDESASVLPIPVHLNSGLTVQQVLVQVATTFRDVAAHADVTLDRIVAALGRERSVDHHPIYQVVLAHANRATPLGGITPRLDLLLRLYPDPGGMTALADFSPELFSRGMIERLVNHWLVVLQSMPGSEQVPIQQLPLLTTDEREQLRAFSNVVIAPGRNGLLHTFFEQQVERTPDAIALAFEGQTLTYSLLNRRANQLARSLRARGVEPDRIVGISLERSIDMLIAVLAVLKAGGAYVPIDPAYPAHRVTFMLRDSAPHLVITSAATADSMPLQGVTCVRLDFEWNSICAEDDSNLDPASLGLTDRHLAYVIYTSGSTGEPNGVMVEHRNVVSYWPVIERIYREPTVCRRVAINAPLTFDVSVQQYLLLLSGCSLFIVPDAVRRDAHRLLDFLEQNTIEGIDCTPSQLNAWMSAGFLERSGYGLRTVVVGGEALDAPLWASLSQRSNLTCYNVYGPTESTVFCTATQITAQSTVPHIGWPTENARIYILDADMNQVPIGVAGEIFVGGGGVARGYLNRPELTPARFTADLFVTDPGARMYRTGDVGRWRADGSIEFVGRNDSQIKVRGYRVELGEIKTHLLRHPRVSEAEVMAREDAPGERRLVAYITTHEREPPTAQELREHLERALPDYMVPSAFVMLSELPLMPNGKLDRRALPTGLELTIGEPPEGELEEALADIWRQVLRVQRVGRRQTFRELGGHSVQAMRVVVRIAERFGIPTSFPDVFRYPTISQLAEMVRQRDAQQRHVESQDAIAGAENGMA